MNVIIPNEDELLIANEFLIAVSSFYKKTEKANESVKSKVTTSQFKVTTAQSKATTSQSKVTTKAFKTKHNDYYDDESTSKKRACINQKENFSINQKENIQTDTHQQQKSSDQPIYVSNQKKLWHNDDQYTTRMSVCLIIEQELRKNFHPDHADVVAKKLALAIKRIDDYLYCSANSLDEYKNETTLKLRLEEIHLQLTSKKLSSRSTSSSTTTLPIQQVPQSIPIIHRKLIVENEKQQMDHKAEILRQQQERLLMLQHASKCTNENGICTFSPSCHAMKILWHHIKSCKDNNCETKHCISSKYVLSHYSNCKDSTCERCFPVREVMRSKRSNEKK